MVFTNKPHNPAFDLTLLSWYVVWFPLFVFVFVCCIRICVWFQQQHMCNCGVISRNCAMWNYEGCVDLYTCYNDYYSGLRALSLHMFHNETKTD